MKPRTPTGAARAQVVATVEAWVRAFGHGPTRAELAKRLQISREVAGRHVSKAADAGQLVVATGNGKARRIGLPAMPRGAS